MHIGERNGSLPQSYSEDWNSPLHRQPHHLTEDALSYLQIPSEEELNNEATYPTRAKALVKFFLFGSFLSIKSSLSF